MDETKQHRMMQIAYVGVTIMIWLMRMGKRHAASEQKEHKKNKGGEKASIHATRETQQRRIIQQRISKWNGARKVSAKDWKKYRHK
eukprot:5997525-Pleurochrysis_carterae.AAC.2